MTVVFRLETEPEIEPEPGDWLANETAAAEEAEVMMDFVSKRRGSDTEEKSLTDTPRVTTTLLGR